MRCACGIGGAAIVALECVGVLSELAYKAESAPTLFTGLRYFRKPYRLIQFLADHLADPLRISLADVIGERGDEFGNVIGMDLGQPLLELYESI